MPLNGGAENARRENDGHKISGDKNRSK